MLAAIVVENALRPYNGLLDGLKTSPYNDQRDLHDRKRGSVFYECWQLLARTGRLYGQVDPASARVTCHRESCTALELGIGILYPL